MTESCIYSDDFFKKNLIECKYIPSILFRWQYTPVRILIWINIHHKFCYDFFIFLYFSAAFLLQNRPLSTSPCDQIKNRQINDLSRLQTIKLHGTKAIFNLSFMR